VDREIPLTIGRLARLAGVGVPTVRFYERKGLLIQPRRPAVGYRQYPREAIERLRFIQSAKRLGFSLREIRELLALRAKRGEPCLVVRERATAKLRDVDERLRELGEFRAALDRLISTCTAPRSISDCTILAALSEGKDESWPPTTRARAASPRAKSASKTA
jgi:MerR family copper efflux transcriptional regulator